MSETPCNWVEKSLFIPTWCLPPFVWWLPPWWRRAGGGCRRIPSPSSFRVNSFCSCAGSWERLILSLPYLFAGVDCCVSFSRLFVQSLFDSFGFGVVFTLVHRTFFPLAVEYRHPTIFTSLTRFCCNHVWMVFFCNFVTVCAECSIASHREQRFSRGLFWNRSNM